MVTVFVFFVGFGFGFGVTWVLDCVGRSVAWLLSEFIWLVDCLRPSPALPHLPFFLVGSAPEKPARCVGAFAPPLQEKQVEIDKLTAVLSAGVPTPGKWNMLK